MSGVVTRVASVAVAAVMFVGVAAWPSAAATPTRSYVQRGPCDEVALAIPVEKARLEKYIPDRFTIMDLGGQTKTEAVALTTLGVFIGACELTIDERPPETAIVSGVFAADVVDPEGNSAEFDLSWVASAPSVYGAYRSLAFGELSRQASYGATTVGPVRKITASQPDGRIPFTVEAHLVGGGDDDVVIDQTSIHWSLGADGLVKGTYDHDFHEAGFGEAELTTTPDTVLADILGRTDATAAAIFGQFDHTGTVEGYDG